jgi:hypothetical protein
MSLTELKSEYGKVSSIDKESNGWQEEYDASSKQVIDHTLQRWYYVNYPSIVFLTQYRNRSKVGKSLLLLVLTEVMFRC